MMMPNYDQTCQQELGACPVTTILKTLVSQDSKQSVKKQVTPLQIPYRYYDIETAAVALIHLPHPLIRASALVQHGAGPESKALPRFIIHVPLLAVPGWRYKACALMVDS